MGMFDYIRSSYPLPSKFLGVCQTKDIEEYGISGTLTQYWIDPAGYLWCGDYRGTNTMEYIEEGDPRYNKKHGFLNFEWVPTEIGRAHV